MCIKLTHFKSDLPLLTFIDEPFSIYANNFISSVMMRRDSIVNIDEAQSGKGIMNRDLH